jgi:hypothetical protein
MIGYRYAEAAALVPLLHVAPGPTSILVIGPMAAFLAAESLRWRDTVKVLTDVPITIKDSRVEKVDLKTSSPLSVNAVLLSPEIDPEPFIPVLKKGGVIQAATYLDQKIAGLRAKMKMLTGASVPYREYVPDVLWFVIGSPGGTPKRVRTPPDGAFRVTERFLPALFSFGKDEIPLIFGKEQP